MPDTERVYDQQYFEHLRGKYGEVCLYLMDQLSDLHKGEPYIAFNLDYPGRDGKKWQLNIDLMDGTVDVLGADGGFSALNTQTFRINTVDSPVTSQVLNQFRGNSTTITANEENIFRLATLDQDPRRGIALVDAIFAGTTLIEYFEKLGLEIDFETFKRDFEAALAKRLADKNEA